MITSHLVSDFHFDIHFSVVFFFSVVTMDVSPQLCSYPSIYYMCLVVESVGPLGWEEMLPEGVGKIIKDKRLFGYSRRKHEKKSKTN